MGRAARVWRALVRGRGPGMPPPEGAAGAPRRVGVGAGTARRGGRGGIGAHADPRRRRRRARGRATTAASAERRSAGTAGRAHGGRLTTGRRRTLGETGQRAGRAVGAKQHGRRLPPAPHPPPSAFHAAILARRSADVSRRRSRSPPRSPRSRACPRSRPAGDRDRRPPRPESRSRSYRPNRWRRRERDTGRRCMKLQKPPRLHVRSSYWRQVA